MSQRPAGQNVFLIGDGYAWTCGNCDRTVRVHSEAARRLVRDTHKCKNFLPR